MTPYVHPRHVNDGAYDLSKPSDVRTRDRIKRKIEKNGGQGKRKGMKTYERASGNPAMSLLLQYSGFYCIHVSCTPAVSAASVRSCHDC